MTPLHYATMREHVKICQLLIDHGANVDVADKVRNYTTHDHNCYIVSHLV